MSAPTTTRGPAEGDTPEYVAEMVARADGKEPTKSEEDAGTTEGEQLFAGKYKSVEELEKGYQELQKAFSSRKPAEEAEGEKPEEAPPTSADLPERAEETPEVSEASGDIDFDKYTHSILENGALTDDDYKELAEKHKLPREVVDTYVAGIQTEITKRTDAAVEAVGTPEEFEEVRQWASKSLTEGEYNATQKAIQNAATAEDLALVYSMLATKYRTANPAEPSLVSGDGATGPAMAGYRSRAEISEAMRHPKYQTDPAYRKEVEEKLRITPDNLL